MPLYDYQCAKCHKITEVRHGFGEAHTEPCPHCGGELRRLFNPAGIVFKGSGFYVTDSRKAAESRSAQSKSAESKTSESKSSESKSSESKSAESKSSESKSSESKSTDSKPSGSKESAA